MSRNKPTFIFALLFIYSFVYLLHEMGAFYPSCRHLILNHFFPTEKNVIGIGHKAELDLSVNTRIEHHCPFCHGITFDVKEIYIPQPSIGPEKISVLSSTSLKIRNERIFSIRAPPNTPTEA